VDFECYHKNGKRVFIDAKLNPNLCISRKNKQIDFFITVKNEEVILISKKNSIKSKFIPKDITITKKQDMWLMENCINLSRFVQDKINKEIKKKK
jgi:hypothetical protein